MHLAYYLYVGGMYVMSYDRPGSAARYERSDEPSLVLFSIVFATAVSLFSVLLLTLSVGMNISLAFLTLSVGWVLGYATHHLIKKASDDGQGG